MEQYHGDSKVWWNMVQLFMVDFKVKINVNKLMIPVYQTWRIPVLGYQSNLIARIPIRFPESRTVFWSNPGDLIHVLSTVLCRSESVIILLHLIIIIIIIIIIYSFICVYCRFFMAYLRNPVSKCC